MGTDLYTQPGLVPNFNRLNPSPTAPRLIGFAGFAQTGKDTAASVVNRLYGHTVLSFSDILREFLYAQDLYLSDGMRLNRVVDRHGWEKARTFYPEIRDLQQLTGTEAARDILGPDCWVNAWKARVEFGDWVNPSVRFPNEVEAIHSLGGTVIRVFRPGVNAVNDHPSDIALSGLDLDAAIVNDGSLIDLEGEIQRVLGEFNV